MKNVKLNRVIQIVYPILVYYILYDALNVLFRVMFANSFGKLFCLMLAALVSIPFIYGIYHRLPILRMDGLPKKDALLRDLLLVLLVVVVGVILNIVVANLPLYDYSEGFSRANDTLSDGSLLIKILANVIFVPILEELLYRGIVLGQFSLWGHPLIGIVISSVLFGIMHFNVIQFLYAFLVGIVLGISYVKTHNLVVPILGHALTNLVVILYFM